jgi:hypothetical protein
MFWGDVVMMNRAQSRRALITVAATLLGCGIARAQITEVPPAYRSLASRHFPEPL